MLFPSQQHQYKVGIRNDANSLPVTDLMNWEVGAHSQGLYMLFRCQVILGHSKDDDCHFNVLCVCFLKGSFKSFSQNMTV